MYLRELNGLVSLGVRLHTRVASPDEDLITKRPAVLLFTGDGSFGSKGRSFAPLMESISGTGIHAVIADYAGFGFSEGALADFSISVAVQNGRDALAFLRRQTFVDPSRIGVYAPSFGAIIALSLGATLSAPQAVVLRAPAHDLRGAYIAEFGDERVRQWASGALPVLNDLPSAYIQEAEHFDVLKIADSVKCPTRIIQGQEDKIVTPSGSIGLSKRLCACDLQILDGVGHSFKEPGALEQLTALTIDWFQRSLQPEITTKP